MSQLLARQVLQRLNMREALIYGPSAADVAADLGQLSMAEPKSEQAKAELARAEMLDAYGMSPSAQQKPFAFAAGVAVIPIHGSLINRFGASWGYVTGYNFIRSQLNAALADEDVKAILFDCNSGGGEVAGCFELAEDIFQSRSLKPSTAVVDSACYSACYALASSASRVIVTPTGGAGSIGAVAMHISVEQALEKFGVKVSLIYAGGHKVDGNPFSDLPDPVRAEVQRSVDKTRANFVTLVARNRGLDEKAVSDTEAAVYRAEEALALGLIDAVSTPSSAVAAILDELSGSDDNQETTMSQPNAAAPGGNAPETANAGQTERARCQAILTCEEAKDNSALANHLAFNTDMSVDVAKATLAAAKPAAPKADVVKLQETAQKPQDNMFQTAMDRDQHPDLNPGNGGAGKGEQAELSAADRILMAHGAASGRNYAKQ